MKCNVLVPNTEAQSRAICAVEIADTLQSATDLSPRNTNYGVTVNNQNYVYSMVEITSNVTTFLNNYDQFVLVGNSAVPKTGYDATINRHVAAVDRRYPYVCNNMQVNVGGAASVEGGVLPTTIAGDPV